MKISKIEVHNYRLLKNFAVTLEDSFSLIIGKNNTGKTSLLHILQSFLSTTTNVFNFEDFSVESQKKIIETIESDNVTGDTYEDLKISLRIFIEREEDDNLANISDLILDLDPKNKTILLSFEYLLDFDNLKKVKNDHKEHHIKNLVEFLKKHHRAYFNISRKVVDINDENIFLDIEDKQVKRVVAIQTISAKRDVINGDGDDQKNNKTLSKLSYKYFKPFEDSQSVHIIELQKKLIETDSNLSESYEKIFKEVTDDLKIFSFDGSKILVKSNFQEVNILKENTSVTYDEDGYHLPEDYNGLGYMNLFAIIFELHIIFNKFKKLNENTEPSEVNLLFIEEPEAHTHPQMQYVFINNIKNFLKRSGKDLNLQTVVTTHSSHITSQSDFNDIKYFLNKNRSIEVKNLSDLETKYGTDEEDKARFRFLKQYLTLNRSELFFSDKIIFIEGDTERILLPAMMKKLDMEHEGEKDYIPLLSQKISVIEVGAHSKTFDNFLEFLEIKTLIVTDIDSINNTEKCPVKDGEDTSNHSIKHFIKSKTWDEIKNISEENRIIKKGNSCVYIAYQSEDTGYHARSFEDAFLSKNFDFVKNNKDSFSSLKNKKDFDETPADYYALAEKSIGKKTEFATDILLYSEEKFKNWETPDYIKTGLLWLMKS